MFDFLKKLFTLSPKKEGRKYRTIMVSMEGDHHYISFREACKQLGLDTTTVRSRIRIGVDPVVALSWRDMRGSLKGGTGFHGTVKEIKRGS